jgi:hypothetical protein
VQIAARKRREGGQVEDMGRSAEAHGVWRRDQRGGSGYVVST